MVWVFVGFTPTTPAQGLRPLGNRNPRSLGFGGFWIIMGSLYGSRHSLVQGKEVTNGEDSGALI
jgi:hypothetical protein